MVIAPPVAVNQSFVGDLPSPKINRALNMGEGLRSKTYQPRVNQHRPCQIGVGGLVSTKNE